MLQILNQTLEKIVPWLTPISVIIGILFAKYIHSLLFIVPYIFAFITLAGSLNSDFRKLWHTFIYPLPLFASLIILHVVMPLVAFFIGSFIFDDIYILTGLVLAFSIPTGITSYVWVNIYKGNMSLALCIILFDTLLSPLIVPFTISRLIGAQVNVQADDMIIGMLLMIVLPALFGITINHLTKGQAKELVSPKLAPFTKIGLIAIILINSSAIAPYISENLFSFIPLFFCIIVFSLLGYIISWYFGKYKIKNHESILSMTFCSGMRNNTAGSVIALTYFPSQVSIPIVISMLFQQTLASIVGSFLHKKQVSQILK
jgi:bile acid:Na+ symporter, BASS family